MTTSLRADAARNRAALVEAARLEFAVKGLDAPLDDIARRAELGNATLYRHFATRRALVAAVFTDSLREIVDAAAGFLAEPDPWVGFAGHLKDLCRRQATDRALADLLTSTIAGESELEALRAAAFDAVVELVRRAREAAVLRADFTHQDLVLVLMANAGLLERTRSAAPDAWERHLDFVLDGLRADAATPAAPAPDPGAVHAAMADAARRLGCAH